MKFNGFGYVNVTAKFPWQDISPESHMVAES